MIPGNRTVPEVVGLACSYNLGALGDLGESNKMMLEKMTWASARTIFYFLLISITCEYSENDQAHSPLPYMPLLPMLGSNPVK
jgi:hypothetical protein